LQITIDETKRKRKNLAEEIVQWSLSFLELSSRYIQDVQTQYECDAECEKDLEEHLWLSERKKLQIIAWKEGQALRIVESDLFGQIRALEEQEEEHKTLIARQKAQEERRGLVNEWKSQRQQETEERRMVDALKRDEEKRIIKQQAQAAMPRILVRSKQLLETNEQLKRMRELERVRVLPEIKNPIQVERYLSSVYNMA
jgi:hypothetical protein